MFRVILIIVLILIAIPFIYKAKDYLHEKSYQIKTRTETAKKAYRYWEGEKKDK